MLHTYKYLFTSAEDRDNALITAYPEWDENGSSIQTSDSGDSIIVLGQNFDNTDPENPLPLNEWCVDIVSTEIRDYLQDYLVIPVTPNHVVLGVENYRSV